MKYIKGLWHWDAKIYEIENQSLLQRLIIPLIKFKLNFKGSFPGVTSRIVNQAISSLHEWRTIVSVKVNISIY